MDFDEIIGEFEWFDGKFKREAVEAAVAREDDVLEDFAKGRDWALGKLGKLFVHTECRSNASVARAIGNLCRRMSMASEPSSF